MDFWEERAEERKTLKKQVKRQTRKEVVIFSVTLCGVFLEGAISWQDLRSRTIEPDWQDLKIDLEPEKNGFLVLCFSLSDVLVSLSRVVSVSTCHHGGGLS